jgi:hypothetical protein
VDELKASGKPSLDLEAGGLGCLAQGEREQGRTWGGRAVHRGIREGPEEQSLQDLEPDVVGDLLFPAAGDEDVGAGLRR